MSIMILCSRCHRKYTWEKEFVNERVSCACGLEFWAFAQGETVISTPWNDGISVRIYEAISKTEAPRKADGIHETLQKIGSLPLMGYSLKNYQMETYGIDKMKCGDLVRTLDIIHEDRDVYTKSKKESVSILELHPSHPKAIDIDYDIMIDEGLRLAEERTDFRHEEPPLREWQEKIMEENDARSGILFGDAG